MKQSNSGRVRPKIGGSAQRQVMLGRRLAAEKAACNAIGGVWKTYVKDNLSHSRERADELIRIGTGRTTVEIVRAGKKSRTRIWRDQSIEQDLKSSKIVDRLMKQYIAESENNCKAIQLQLNNAYILPVDRKYIADAIKNLVIFWNSVADDFERDC